MFLRKKPAGEKQIVVKTSAGFRYVFDLVGKKIYIIVEKGMFGRKKGKELPAKEEAKNLAKFLGAFIGGAAVAPIPHEVVHAATAIGLGGRVESWKIGFGLEDSGLLLYTDSPLKSAIVEVAPSFFEAILGLFLIKEGLKRGNTVYFGYGFLSFAKPAARVANSIFQRTDFTNFVSHTKAVLIQTFSGDKALVDSVSNLNEPVAILLTAATIYGTVILGRRYVSKIRAEFVTGWRTKRILRKLKEKDKGLYNALGRHFLWKADKYRNIVLDKL